MVREVVEDACDGCCGGVGASDYEQVAFGPQLGVGEAQTGFGVLCVQEVVEEVFAVGVVALSGTCESLGFAEGHEIVSVTYETWEEESVEAEFMDDRECTTLP